MEPAMNKPVVLFLCTGNSARSQMAEALLRHEAGEEFEVHSAGTEPKGVNPLAVKVMKEIGIDISKARSKHLREYLGRLPVRILIIVCSDAENSCPAIWPGALSRHFWPFEDPAAVQGSEAEKLDKFRQIRDEIHEKIRSWLEELSAKAGTRQAGHPR
jgi:arsenate reductase